MIDNDRNERQGCVPSTSFSGYLDDYGRFPEIGKSMKNVRFCCRAGLLPSSGSAKPIKVHQSHSINQSQSLNQNQSSSRTSLLVFFFLFPFSFFFSFLFLFFFFPTFSTHSFHAPAPPPLTNSIIQPLLGAYGRPLQK